MDQACKRGVPGNAQRMLNEVSRLQSWDMMLSILNPMCSTGAALSLFW